MTDQEACAEKARKILTTWELEPGWKTLPVAELHDLCDANTAFDEAAGGGEDMEWEDYVAFLNGAQHEYDRKYATGV